MNTNRLGTKMSKERSHLKSTERSKSLKGKTSDVEGNIGTVGIGNPELENHIMTEHLEEYRINPNFLQSNHSPQPPKEKPKKTVTVRKLKSSKSLQNKPKERVYVARPVTDEEEIDMMIGFSQYSVDLSDQQIKPHTILGSVTDFKQQALKERQSELLSAKSTIKSAERKLFYQRSEHQTTHDNNDTTHINESKALENWNKQMKERMKQQQYLSKSLGVNEDMIVMNQSENYRSIQEERAIIDRAIPTKDYGKGYRTGSEFWRQVEGIGNDDKGISITLGEAEKGNIAPVEHVGNPSNIKKTMGTDWSKTRRSAKIHKNWLNSSYLDERKNYFKYVIEEIDPYKPYIEGLEVVGHGLKVPKYEDMIKEIGIDDDKENEKETIDLEESKNFDPLEQFPDVYPEAIFGPFLLINGYTAKWEGPPISGCTANSISIQMLFDCAVGDVTSDFIDITNNGTAAIKFQWNKQSDYDPFGMKKVKPIQRFYFDVCEGIILPGVTIKIPFVFKSPNAGIFMEKWCLETNIVLCGGGTIEICLHGTATKEDEYKTQRAQIEEMYRARQTKSMVERMITEMIGGIRTPPRPSTPEETYVTEEDIFALENDNLHYHSDTITELKEFYSELKPDGNWDMSINTLLKDVINLDQEEQKEENLKKLNDVIKPLNHSIHKLIDKKVHEQCYQAICETVDKFVFNSMMLSHGLGMPEKVFIVKLDVVSPKKMKKSAATDVQKTTRADSKNSKKDTPMGKKGTPAKEKTKTEPPPVMKEPSVVEVEEPRPVLSLDKSHPAYDKYIEKMYGQVYNCLLEMAGNISAVLSSHEFQT